MDNLIFKNNMEIITIRFPELAKRLGSVDINKIAIGNAEDGGIFYAVNQGDAWLPISDPVNPIRNAENGLHKMKRRLLSGLSPTVVVGLCPGYILDAVYKHFLSRLKFSEPFRYIYVIVDSLLCLAAWLKVENRSELLQREELNFYWHEDVHEIIRLCEEDEQRSHLFIPVSTLTEKELNIIIEPLADFYLKREKETLAWQASNDEYYDSFSDSDLADIILGKIGRPPRILIPTHSSSTVVQFSGRDTCKAFENLGWETKILKMDRGLSQWRMAKAIHEFKPDILILINHLRIEDEKVKFYPKNLMFITWIQDTMPYVNQKSTAKKWNNMAAERKRDLIIGYTTQLREAGYHDNRLIDLNMIVDYSIFKPLKLTESQKRKYGCDVCFASNRSKPSDLIVREELLPDLQKYGFTEDILMELHDFLCNEYQNEKTFISYEELLNAASAVSNFASLYHSQSEDIKTAVIQKIFWDMNDVIYRNTAIEWICGIDGIKLHIYGKGWEDHPTMAKYSKGYIKHGEELNLAYNAAKYCLHLNSYENRHQRLVEISASNGRTLTRSRNEILLINDGVDAFLSKLIKASSKNIEMSGQEKKHFDEYVFFVASKIMLDNPEWDSGELLKRVHYQIKLFLSLNSDLLLSRENRLNFNSRTELESILQA